MPSLIPSSKPLCRPQLDTGRRFLQTGALGLPSGRITHIRPTTSLARRLLLDFESHESVSIESAKGGPP